MGIKYFVKSGLLLVQSLNYLPHGLSLNALNALGSYNIYEYHNSLLFFFYITCLSVMWSFGSLIWYLPKKQWHLVIEFLHEKSKEWCFKGSVLWCNHATRVRLFKHKKVILKKWFWFYSFYVNHKLFCIWLQYKSAFLHSFFSPTGAFFRSGKI